jgi:hypothetical protein
MPCFASCSARDSFGFKQPVRSSMVQNFTEASGAALQYVERVHGFSVAQRAHQPLFEYSMLVFALQCANFCSAAKQKNRISHNSRLHRSRFSGKQGEQR